MTKSKANEPISAFDLFPKSVALVKKNLSLFALVYSVPVLMTVLQLFKGKSNTLDLKHLSSINITTMLGVSASVAALLIVLSAILQTMAVRLELSAALGKKVDVQQLWDFTRKYFFRLLGLGIVLGLILIVGFIALIVPGLYLLKSFILAPYYMIDKDLGIIESLKQSKEDADDYSGALWGLVGVTLLISIVPSIFGRVGSLISTALSIAYAVAPALRYAELNKSEKAPLG